MRSIDDILRTKGFRFKNIEDIKEVEQASTLYAKGLMSQEEYAKVSRKDIRVSNGSSILCGKENRDEYIFPLGDGTYRFGGDFYIEKSDTRVNFAFSVQMGWEHLSVSTPTKTPTWDQMCAINDAIFEDEEETVEFHPKKSEYINVHPHCLHIWRPRIDEILKLYNGAGFITNVRQLDFGAMLADKMDLKDEYTDINKFVSSEGGDINSGYTIVDNVPVELIGLTTPPSILVGTKTREGLEAFKNLAHSKGIKVGLGDVLDNE